MTSLENSAVVTDLWQWLTQVVVNFWHQCVEVLVDGRHTIIEHISRWNQVFWEQLHQVQLQVADGLSTITTTIAVAELWQVGLYWILLVVAIVGVIGAFVPALPGVTLIVGVVVIWGLVHGFAGLAWALGVAIFALLLSVAIDYLAGIIGAQKVGASRWGQIGAFVGMTLGFFGLIPALPFGGPIFGILIGTVLGAFTGEFLHRHDLTFWPRVQQSFRVGIAIVVGSLVGNLLQGILALITFVVFVIATWGTVYG